MEACKTASKKKCKSAVTVVFKNEGLTQERVQEKNSSLKTMSLHLPLFLTMPLWIRHGYTLKDIRTTLQAFPAEYLWQVASLYGVCVSNSAIKLSFAAPESMIFGSKSIVVAKIMSAISKLLPHKQEKQRSVLDRKRSDWVPLLPTHAVGQERFRQLVSDIPPITYDESCIDLVAAPRRWCDILFVPYRVEYGDCDEGIHDAVYCVRVVCDDVFTMSRNQHPPGSRVYSVPQKVRWQGQLFACTDEAMFFTKN